MTGVPPLPEGFRIVLDPAVRPVGEGAWLGGSPTHLVRLTGAGRTAWRELLDGAVRSATSGALARRLVDSGLAHPVPPRSTAPPRATVVIPVRDRPRSLDRCLSAVGDRCPVIVVDDASLRPDTVAAVAARHGARLVRRDRNGGPGVARNDAFDLVGSEIVAFVDSDCEPEPGWIDTLLPHFADPLVAAVAPRILAAAPSTYAGRYARRRCALDLGDRPAPVSPGGRVSYVPTAALLVRRDALASCGPFDPALRYGEDVDLVWRLARAGWRVRYEPGAAVRHHEPRSWSVLLRRRFHYGTSAATLATRHPGAAPPLVIGRWPALVAAALLWGRPSAAVLAACGFAVATRRALRGYGMTEAQAARTTGIAMRTAWLAIGRYGTQFAPALLVAASVAGGKTPARRLTRRAAAASLLLGPPLANWAGDRRELDPVRFTLGYLAEEAAYGLGVAAGCAHERTAAPLRPVPTRSRKGVSDV